MLEFLKRKKTPAEVFDLYQGCEAMVAKNGEQYRHATARIFSGHLLVSIGGETIRTSGIESIREVRFPQPGWQVQTANSIYTVLPL